MTLAAPPVTNVSLLLRERAAEAPERLAVRGPDGRSLSFAALEERVDALARGLVELGLVPGDRVSLFVRPGPELVALVHALFRTGAVPVLIDPGMGRRSLLACVERTRPRALVGVGRAHLARTLFPRAFRSCELLVHVGRRVAPGSVPLDDLVRQGGAPAPPPHEPEADAAILFTSGSTGPPKGVVYTHAHFAAQLDALRALYELAPGEVDCACFPLFALFDHALGMSSVFPRLDPSRPGACDPAAIVAAIERDGATFAFGSPAIWRRVLPWLAARGRRLATLRRVAIAGAPVPPRLVLGLRERLAPGGDVHTPYGATEALPVADVSGAELAPLLGRVEGGEGVCVGRPAPGVEVRALRIDDAPLPRWRDALVVPDGEPGELCVRGAVVTRRYADDPAATERAKVADEDGFWHRMGDVGRVDADGRLWILGRVSHRIETAAGVRFPVPAEAVVDAVPGVRRSALVPVGPRGRQRAVLVVEPERGARRGPLRRRVATACAAHAACREAAAVLLKRRLPVDVRHNAKIHRLELGRWAERRLRVAGGDVGTRGAASRSAGASDGGTAGASGGATAEASVGAPDGTGGGAGGSVGGRSTDASGAGPGPGPEPRTGPGA